MLSRLGVLTSVVLWGVSFVATKAVLREISPMALVFARFALGVAFLFAVLAARGRSSPPPPGDWRSLALLGFVGIFVHQMLQAYGLTLTTAVNTGWLIGLIPIWSALLSAIILGERFGPLKLAGFVVGFAGAILVVTRGEISARLLSLPTTRGDLLILASTVNWAVYTVIGQETLRRLGANRAIAFSMLAGWAMLGPFFLAAGGWREYAALSAAGWLELLFLGFGCSGVAYLFWYAALERLEPSRVASFLYLEPFVTFAAAAILLGEPVNATTVLGGLLVVAGVVLVQRAPAAPLISRGEPG